MIKIGSIIRSMQYQIRKKIELYLIKTIYLLKYRLRSPDTVAGYNRSGSCLGGWQRNKQALLHVEIFQKQLLFSNIFIQILNFSPEVIQVQVVSRSVLDKTSGRYYYYFIIYMRCYCSCFCAFNNSCYVRYYVGFQN